jgi:hypothetical protein
MRATFFHWLKQRLGSSTEYCVINDGHLWFDFNTSVSGDSLYSDIDTYKKYDGSLAESLAGGDLGNRQSTCNLEVEHFGPMHLVSEQDTDWINFFMGCQNLKFDELHAELGKSFELDRHPNEFNSRNIELLEKLILATVQQAEIHKRVVAQSPPDNAFAKASPTLMPSTPADKMPPA